MSSDVDGGGGGQVMKEMYDPYMKQAIEQKT